MRAYTIPFIFGLMILTACGHKETARELFGFDRSAPDAFSVSPQAPLALPSDYTEALPRPQPGIRRPQEVSPTQTAQAVVFDNTAPVATQNSAAEQFILSQTGAERATPDIRTVVNKEADKDAKSTSAPLEFLIFWRKAPEPGVAVDAAAEANRLKENAAKGKPATDGATPVIKNPMSPTAPKEIE